MPSAINRCLKSSPRTRQLSQHAAFALDAEQAAGTLDVDDGPGDPLERAVALGTEVVVEKAELLGEYFAMEIDAEGLLHSLPMVVRTTVPYACLPPKQTNQPPLHTTARFSRSYLYNVTRSDDCKEILEL